MIDYTNPQEQSSKQDVMEQKPNGFFSKIALAENCEVNGKPIPGEDLSGIVQVIPSTSYSLSYACILVPRFNDHYLAGDIVENLNGWMLDICISYGWQLKHINIDSNYLHWVMAVNITSYPTKFMKLVRKHTSEKIFDNFPRLRAKNVSNDFWAPWYYIGTGEQPFAQKVVMEFLGQVRKQQGL